jgi:aminomethyltransferase
MVATTLQETPLADAHRKAGARMVDFAGWNMPVQYKSIVVEHTAVRNKVGIFDVSHMGEFVITGDLAGDFIQYVIANDLKKLTKTDSALYTQLVRPSGGTVDDLIVYRRKDDFLIKIGNGCNRTSQCSKVCRCATSRLTRVCWHCKGPGQSLF